MSEKTAEIIDIYNKIKPEITDRIKEFKNIWLKSTEEEIFAELVFCIMTPQSKARSCGKALQILKEKNLIMEGSSEEIAKNINIVRFRNNKASYIVNARKLLSENGSLKIKKKLINAGSPSEMRYWLVSNIKGIGFKEASHFLRNTGFGGSLAILDRHILKNMLLLSVINEIPASIPPKRYMELEQKLLNFAKKIKIPPDHLDFVLWYKEAGEVYK
ncbi:MAG: N-glycosylase/DNA lyase [Spirochaetes bacterium]|nr:N-glycosylase/DNA lyase [Spirochaetota bacterium]